MSTPNITLTATLEDITGVAAGSAANPAKMVITLCNYGQSLPRVPGLVLPITTAAFNGAVGGKCALALTYSGPSQTIADGTALELAGLTTFTALNGESLPSLGSSSNLVNVQINNLYPSCVVGSPVAETGTIELPGVVIAKVIVAETSTGTQIIVSLWGNDQIVPAGTFYCIEVLDGGGNVVQCANYEFTGAQTIDLSNAVPIVPAPPAPTPTVGSWTPVNASTAVFDFTTTEGQYIRQGRQITAWFRIVFPATADTTPVVIGGLPFPSETSGVTFPISGAPSYNSSSTSNIAGFSGAQNATTFDLPKFGGTNLANNSTFSGKELRGTVTYLTD